MRSAAAHRALRFIDGFVSPRVRGELNARVVAAACLISAVSHAGTCIAISMQGLYPVATANFLAAVASGLLAWMFRRGASGEVVANGLLSVLFLFAAGVAGASGGDANSALHTLTIVPGIAILILGWRTGALWMAAAVGFTVALGVLRSRGFDFPVQLEPEKVALGKYPGVVALTVGVSAVILFSEQLKRRALQDLVQARRVAVQAERRRRELETAMLESQKLESLGVMASGVAHDFNNLLTTILGNASVLPGDTREETEALASDIVLAAEQAADLTDQLLVYTGRSRSVRGPVSLSEVVREVDSLAEATKGPDVVLRFALSEEATTVVADPGQIRQVALNLVTNACAAIEGPGTVIVRTGTEEEEAFLEVEDDGAGMAEEVAARVFDPFFTTKPTGRGLGLSAVLGIVRSHDGRIAVDSVPGRGTRIRVLMRTVALEAEPTSQPRDCRGFARVEGRVLVVDDIEAVRRFAGRTLSAMGFDVLEACDGAEALRLVDAHPGLRLVLLDATMPGLRGDRVHAEIAKRNPDLPVILSTGDAQGFARIDPDTPGTFWLAKPYRAAALEEVATRAVASELAASIEQGRG